MTGDAGDKAEPVPLSAGGVYTREGKDLICNRKSQSLGSQEKNGLTVTSAEVGSGPKSLSIQGGNGGQDKSQRYGYWRVGMLQMNLGIRTHRASGNSQDMGWGETRVTANYQKGDGATDWGGRMKGSWELEATARAPRMDEVEAPRKVCGGNKM